ncbi:MAG: AAA family ATPase [Caldilineaceae bacterium]|nr:AAA family ATPase [Caldilineaceae bacterium]
MPLDLLFLGPYEARRSDQLIAFPTERARALLAYLAYYADQPQSRQILADLFWYDRSEAAARNSLRTELSRLRQAIGDIGATKPILVGTRLYVEFVKSSEVTVDLHQFQALLITCRQHAHPKLSGCPPCIERLRAAVALYRGDFLAELKSVESPPFEEWLDAAQDSLRAEALWALELLIEHSSERQELDQVVAYARRQLQIQPWREVAHQHIMRALTLQGQRAAAVRQFELCRRALETELAVDPSVETVALYEQIRAGDLFMPAPQAQNPYQGLHPFERAHAVFFFGRESITERLLETVRARPFVTLIGPSGSGKSSLIQAGLLPKLTEFTHVVSFRPGEDPFRALAEAFQPLLSLEQSAPDWATLLRQQARGLQDLADNLDLLPKGEAASAAERRLLLIVDQFEELFTITADPTDRQSFLTLLLSALDHERTRISMLISIRADFMTQALASASLAAALQDAAIVLGPMNREEIRRAIEQPALRQGVVFEPGLVERLLDDVGAESGNLPLLEFTLTRLWQKQRDGWLTHAAYAETERIVGALTHYADGIYARLAPQEQMAARRIFLQLVQPGQGTEDVRRTATRAEIGEADWLLVQRMADARLVITNQNANGDETAELVHEALIREWRRLQSWLDEDREFRLWQQRVQVNLGQWQQNHRENGALLRGGPLVEAERWMDQRKAELSDSLRAYIEASLAYRQQRLNEEEAQRQRELAQLQALAEAEHQRAETEARTGVRLRWFASGAALAFLIALIAAGFAYQSTLMAEHERTRAEANAQLALARQLSAQTIRNMGSEIDLALLLSVESDRLNLRPTDKTTLWTEMAISPFIEKVLHGPHSPIFSISFSADGRHLFSTDDKGNVLIWPIHDGIARPTSFIEQDGQISGVALSPRGDRMAINRGHSVDLWDLTTRQIIVQLTDHADTVVRLAFSHDGTRLITADKSKAMFVRDAATGAQLGPPLASDENQPVSADGRIFAQIVEEDDRQFITFWDSQSDERRRSLEDSHSASIHGFDFSGDQRLLATASFDGSIGLWDVETGRLQGETLHGHDGRVLAVKFSPDGETLVSGGTDNRLLLWDLRDKPHIDMRLRGHNNWVRAIAFSADGRWLASADADGKIILWRMSRHILSEHTNRVRAVALSPDGQTLVTASFDRQLGIWDATTPQLKQMLETEHEHSITNAKFSPDGNTLVSIDAGGAVIFWDTARWSPRFPPRRRHDSVLIGLAFSADGRLLATGDFPGFIRIWDVSTGEPLGTPIKAHQGWALSLAFSPDGEILASGSTDASLKLWDLTTRRMRTELPALHSNWITDLLFTPDGRALLSASSDHTIRVWDVASGEAHGDPLVGHEGQVWAIQFFPPHTDQILVSLGGDGALMRWDWPSRQPLAPPLRAEIETESMALNPDGSYLYLATFDASAQRWELNWTPWRERACQIANRNLTLDEWRTYLYELSYQKSCPEIP